MLVENPICTRCGSDMFILPIKSKVKLEPLAFCPDCDPNVVSFWEKKRKPKQLPPGDG